MHTIHSIKSGSLDVLASGQVLSNGMNDIDMQMAENDLMKLSFAVDINDEKNHGYKVELRGPIWMVIRLKNPHLMLNYGNSDPLLIGAFRTGGSSPLRELHVTFRVTCFGTPKPASYGLRYTLYQGDVIPEAPPATINVTPSQSTEVTG
jgi:hypothetical protein